MIELTGANYQNGAVIELDNPHVRLASTQVLSCSGMQVLATVEPTAANVRPAEIGAIDITVANCPEPTPDLDASPMPVFIIENDTFTIVRLIPEQGKLKGLLKEQSQSAIAQGRQPVVMFDAEW